MNLIKTDLLQGTLDLIILRILISGDRHGYSIAKRIELISKDVLSVQQGSLYPALHRLEERGLIKSKWGVTETKRRAKFYKLTKSGKKQVEKETAYWKQFSGAINQIVQHCIGKAAHDIVKESIFPI